MIQGSNFKKNLIYQIVQLPFLLEICNRKRTKQIFQRIKPLNLVYIKDQIFKRTGYLQWFCDFVSLFILATHGKTQKKKH